MLSALKKLFQPKAAEDGQVAMQPPGQPFPWPSGTRLTALETVVIAIPTAALGAEEKIGSVVLGDADIEIRLPQKPGDPHIFLRLKEGSSVSLSKSVQGMVVADDRRPRKIRVTEKPNPPLAPTLTANVRQK